LKRLVDTRPGDDPCYTLARLVVRQGASLVVAVAIIALLTPVALASSADAGSTDVDQIEKMLSTAVLPDRATDSYAFANTASCRRARGRKVRCKFRAVTLDGDVVWTGRASFSRVSRTGDKQPYRLQGSKTICDPPGSTACDEREFTWTGAVCGSVPNGVVGEGEGAAIEIHAVGLKCVRARAIARRCVLGDRGNYRHSTVVLTWRSLLRRGARFVSFAVIGGGGCSSS
jgi:hypothetical protein